MAHEDRRIPIGYVAEARLIAWGKSHVNFQKALADEEVEKHIQVVRAELIAWAQGIETLQSVLASYIGENEADFSMLARQYLVRRFADATANGLIFEGKSSTQVESETIFSKEWIYQMIVECSEEIKRRVDCEMSKIGAITLAIFGSFGRYMCEEGNASGEFGDDDKQRSEDRGCVKPPYSM